MVNERDNMRRRIRAIMGKDVVWVEPNVRSTFGAGVPDCKFKFGSVEIPVELKFWEQNKFGLKCTMRPAQIRYHVMGARKGKRSAILFGVEVPGSNKEFAMYLVPNTKCPKENYELKKKDCYSIGYAYDNEASVKLRIQQWLCGEVFWYA